MNRSSTVSRGRYKALSIHVESSFRRPAKAGVKELKASGGPVLRLRSGRGETLIEHCRQWRTRLILSEARQGAVEGSGPSRSKANSLTRASRSRTIGALNGPTERSLAGAA